MCKSPIQFKNPAYGQKSFTYQSGEIFETSQDVRFTKEFIRVPCGKCVECKKSQYSSYLQRIQIESMTSYVFMLTLTYDDAHIPSIHFTAGQENLDIFYSNIKHVQDMFKRVRKYPIFENRDMRYFAVTEYGTAKFRPHHHLLIFVAKLPTDTKDYCYHLEKELFDLFKFEWRINVGSRRVPLWQPLFTYKSKLKNGKLYRNYDLHLVSDRTQTNTNVIDPNAISSATKYLISYMLKPNEFEQVLVNALKSFKSSIDDKKLYRNIEKLLKTRVYFSKYLGFGFDSNGVRVKPSIAYARCNSNSLSLWYIIKEIKPIKTYDYPIDHLINCACEYLHIKRELYDVWVNHVRNRSSLKHFKYMFVQKAEDLFYNICMAISYVFEPDLYQSLISDIDSCESYSVTMFPTSIYDVTYKHSKAYKAIRSFIDESHNLGLPYIGFRYEDNGVKYVPLCGFYKKYCITEKDLQNWLHRVGVSCLDELEFNESSFTKTSRICDYNTGKSVEHSSNTIHNPLKQITQKKQQNFDLLKKESIFAPKGSFIIKLYERIR